MKEIISVLIPTFNLNSKFKEIVSIYSTHPKVKIIVSDDSSDKKIQQKIKKICKEKEIIYFKGPQTTPIKNWNFLLEKIDTPFFVLNHHDDCPNNLKFLEYLNKKNTGILLLPCTSYIFNKKYVRLSSRHQKFQVKLLRYLPNIMINLFLAPTASVIINKKLVSSKFNEDLKWYVDNEWYYRLLKECKTKKLKLSFFSKTRINSHQNSNSITLKIKNNLENIKIYEKNLLKDSKLIPNKFIHLFQKIISLIFTIDSKLIRLTNFLNN